MAFYASVASIIRTTPGMVCQAAACVRAVGAADLLSAEASKKIDVGHAYTEKVIIPLNTRF